MEFIDEVVPNNTDSTGTGTATDTHTVKVTEKDSFSSQFWISFSEKQAIIAATLDDPTNVSLEIVATAKVQISELQDFVTAAAIDLPKYDLRRSTEVRGDK